MKWLIWENDSCYLAEMGKLYYFYNQELIKKEFFPW